MNGRNQSRLCASLQHSRIQTFIVAWLYLRMPLSRRQSGHWCDPHQLRRYSLNKWKSFWDTFTVQIVISGKLWPRQIFSGGSLPLFNICLPCWQGSDSLTRRLANIYPVDFFVVISMAGRPVPRLLSPAILQSVLGASNMTWVNRELARHSPFTGGGVVLSEGGEFVPWNVREEGLQSGGQWDYLGGR